MRRNRMSRGRRTVAGALALAAVAWPGLAPATAGPVPQPLTIDATGTNAVGRIHSPGRRCADGGSGQYRHSGIEATLPAGRLGNQPGHLRGTFAVHHDGDEPVGTPLTGPAATAFLLGTESHVTLTTERGAVQLRLSAGSCATPTLAFDGTTVSGAGTFALDPVGTTGAYRSATGSGAFTLDLGVAPGADNPWHLTTSGNLTVLQPALAVEAVSTSWGSLGVDYATRRVSVTYKVTNTGPGDAFGAVANGTSSSTAGVTPLGPTPVALGDLPAGQSTTFTVRYQLGLLSPCALVILGCRFTTRVTATLPDALDKGTPVTTPNIPVRAPDFPPPL